MTTLPKSVIFVPASYYSGDPALVVREDFGGALRTRLAFGAKVGSELIPALTHHMVGFSSRSLVSIAFAVMFLQHCINESHKNGGRAFIQC